MDLFAAMEIDKKLPLNYFFIGDEAFTNMNQFLSPWPGRGLDRYKVLLITGYPTLVRLLSVPSVF